MPNPFRSTLETPPTRRSSWKAIENNKQIEKPKVGRLIIGNYHHPDRIVYDDPSDDQSDELDGPPTLEDISKQEFTVS